MVMDLLNNFHLCVHKTWEEDKDDMMTAKITDCGEKVINN